MTVCDVKEEEGRRTAEALAETYGKEKVVKLFIYSVLEKLLPRLLDFNEVNWVRCDVTSEDDWKALFDSTEEAFGGQKVGFIQILQM